MTLSRRQFFERLRDAAEGPHRWREKRIAQLREYALSKAPAEWAAEQREEAGRAVERKLTYMSDDTLRGPGMRRYVEAVVRSKDIFFQSSHAEEEYYRNDDPYYEDYSGG